MLGSNQVSSVGMNETHKRRRPPGFSLGGLTSAPLPRTTRPPSGYLPYRRLENPENLANSPHFRGYRPRTSTRLPACCWSPAWGLVDNDGTTLKGTSNTGRHSATRESVMSDGAKIVKKKDQKKVLSRFRRACISQCSQSQSQSQSHSHCAVCSARAARKQQRAPRARATRAAGTPRAIRLDAWNVSQ